MKTTINQSLDQWVLCISRNDTVIKSYTLNKLIDALELASVLQLHVDNVADLELTQYLNQGVTNEAA